MNTGEPPESDKEDEHMALKNLASWDAQRTPAACGSACGASDPPAEAEKKPAACGAADKPAEEEKKPAACGAACGASDK